MNDVAHGLEQFVRARFRVSPEDRRFSRRANLWKGGYLDSIGVVELIAYVETTFGVVVPDEVLFDPEFTSIDGITRIVHGLLVPRSA